MGDHECIDCRREADDGAIRRPRKIVTADGEPKRCTSHLRQFTTRQRQQARGRSVERTYDISAPDAGELLMYQDGVCWICRKATGASKLLAVEHDHADNWVRGRLCSTCNQFITRQLGDDPNAAQRLVQYLSGDTPYRRMLASRVVEASQPFRPFEALHLMVDGNDVAIWYRVRTPEWEGTWLCMRTTLDVLKMAATPKR